MSGDKLQDYSELLSAYLDNELDAAERTRVEALLDREPAAVRLLSELRETHEMLQNLPEVSAPPGLLEDVMARVERQALLGEQNDEPQKTPVRIRWGPIRAAAAVIVIVGGAGAWMMYQSAKMEKRIAYVQITPLEKRSAPESPAVDVPEKKASAPRAGDALVELRPGSVKQELETKSGKFGAAKTSPPADLVTESIEEKQSAAKEESTGLDRMSKAPRKSADNEKLQQHDYEIASEKAKTGQTVELGMTGRETAGESQTEITQPMGEEGASVEALVQADFQNEPVELTLRFSNTQDRDDFSQQTLTYLSANQMLNIADPSQREQVKEPLNQSVFVPGSTGVNNVDSNSRQFLVWAPPEELVKLVDYSVHEAGQLTNAPSVSLRVGELRTEGVEQTRSVAQLLEKPDWQQQLIRSQQVLAQRRTAGTARVEGGITQEREKSASPTSQEQGSEPSESYSKTADSRGAMIAGHYRTPTVPLSLNEGATVQRQVEPFSPQGIWGQVWNVQQELFEMTLSASPPPNYLPFVLNLRVDE